jgi:hypothetical protein
MVGMMNAPKSVHICSASPVSKPVAPRRPSFVRARPLDERLLLLLVVLRDDVRRPRGAAGVVRNEVNHVVVYVEHKQKRNGVEQQLCVCLGRQH